MSLRAYRKYTRLGYKLVSTVVRKETILRTYHREGKTVLVISGRRL